MATDKFVLIDERLARAIEQWAVTDNATCKALAQEALIVLGVRRDEITALNKLSDEMDKQIGALQQRNDNLLAKLLESQQSGLKALDSAISREETFALLSHVHFVIDTVCAGATIDTEDIADIMHHAIAKVASELQHSDDMPF